MTDFQYQMAFIDWDKYGGCYRKLHEHPDNLMNCVYTMLGEFSQKDLLKGLPNDAPWDSIQQIKSLGQRAIDASSQGKALDAQAEASLRRHCHVFGDWAASYFSSSDSPWNRSSGIRSSDAASAGGCGCKSILLLLLAIGCAFGGYSWFASQSGLANPYAQASPSGSPAYGLPDRPRSAPPEPVPPSPKMAPVAPSASTSESTAAPASSDFGASLSWETKQDTALGTAYKLAWRSSGSEPLSLAIEGDANRFATVPSTGSLIVFVSRKVRYRLTMSDGMGPDADLTLEPNYSMATGSERQEEGPALTQTVDLIAQFAAQLDFQHSNPSHPLEAYIADEIGRADRSTLRVYRNAIPASVGYTFRDEALAGIFGARPWYQPSGVTAEALDELFNDLQRANSAYLKSIEEKR